MRRRAAALVLGVLAASALTFGGNAAAAPPHGDQAKMSHERVVDYWTPHRRAAATPLDVTVAERRQHSRRPGSPMHRPTARAKTRGHRGAPPQTGRWAKGRNVVDGALWPASRSQVARTTGKAFFLLDGNQYVCSGSAVRGPRGVDLVLTAGHCLTGEAGSYATFFLFVPGWDGTPWSESDVWTATSVFVTEEWQQSEELSDDTGLAVVTNDEGKTFDALPGRLPTMDFLAAHRHRRDNRSYSVFGYPSAAPYDGVNLGYCQGPVDRGLEVDDTLSMACGMPEGSSGGPWYSGPRGTGGIASVTSFSFEGSDQLFGPTFDAPEARLLAQAWDGVCTAREVCSADLSATP
jgi:hypothetical protein